MPDVLSQILAGAAGTMPPAEEAGREGGAIAPMPHQPGTGTRAGPTIAGAREAAVLALLAALTGGQGGAQGVATLIGRLREAGLGAEVESWIGRTDGRTLRAAELARTLPPAMLDDVEASTGIGREEALGELARGLPGLVQALTPQGRMPERDAELDGIAAEELLRHFGMGRSS